jgi:hypothetical protein
MRRLRPVAYLVQPQFMVDDGENLTPLSVDPVSVPAADWPNVVALMAQATEQLRLKVERSPETESITPEVPAPNHPAS